MLSVPPLAGVPVSLFEIFWNPELVGGLDWLLVPPPPLLLPPHAVAIVAMTARPATAVTPRVLVSIDTLLLAESPTPRRLVRPGAQQRFRPGRRAPST